LFTPIPTISHENWLEEEPSFSGYATHLGFEGVRNIDQDIDTIIILCDNKVNTPQYIAYKYRSRTPEKSGVSLYFQKIGRELYSGGCVLVMLPVHFITCNSLAINGKNVVVMYSLT